MTQCTDVALHRSSCRDLHLSVLSLQEELLESARLVGSFMNHSWVMLALCGSWVLSGKAACLWLVLHFTIDASPLEQGNRFPPLLRQVSAPVLPYDKGHPLFEQMGNWFDQMTAPEDLVRLRVECMVLEAHKKDLQACAKVAEKRNEACYVSFCLLLDHGRMW